MRALELFDGIPDRIVRIVAILVVALLLQWLVAWVIRRALAASVRSRALLSGRAAERLDPRYDQRARTVASLLGSIASFVIILVALLMVLDLLGLPLTPLIASAGVGGVAIGFGAQSLVKDLISGMFMVFEDQYGVGDTITVGDVSGVVEQVGLRVTQVRDADGTAWYIRNGEISRVGNQSQGEAVLNLDVQANAAEDPTRVVTVLRDAVANLPDEAVVRFRTPPTVLGVQSVAGNAMAVRIQGRCDPGRKLEASRALLAHCVAALEAAGVKGAY